MSLDEMVIRRVVFRRNGFWTKCRADINLHYFITIYTILLLFQ